MPSILISGASVAGPAPPTGWRPSAGTSRSSNAPRSCATRARTSTSAAPAGTSSAGWGSRDAVRAASTGEQGTELVDSGGEVVAAFGVQGGEQDGPTPELEILRGELSRVLYDRTPDIVGWRFGDAIESLGRRPDEVTSASRAGTSGPSTSSRSPKASAPHGRVRRPRLGDAAHPRRARARGLVLRGSRGEKLAATDLAQRLLGSPTAALDELELPPPG